MTEHVKAEIDAGIMTLTLARADKKNALSNAMYSAMSDGLERAEKDPAVRVVCSRGTATALRPAMTWPISVPRPVATPPVSLRRIGSSATSARPPVRS